MDPSYLSLVERMLDGFYRATADGNLIDVSTKAARILGYDRADELIGKVTMADLWVEPDERDLLLAELREHGEARGFETSLKRKDGSRVRVELTVTPIFDDEGKLTGTQGVVRDVTERSSSEQQFRSLIRNSPGAMFRYTGGKAPHYAFMSEAIKDITGYPPDFFTSDNGAMLRIVHPADVETAAALKAAVPRAGEHYDFEFRIVTPTNETRWIQLRGGGGKDRVTDIDVIDGVVLDVTEAHRIADELAERERQVQSLIRNVPGAIYRFAEQEDGTWRFAYMSPAIEPITGYAPEYFVGQADPFEKILHPDDRERVGGLIGEAIATGGGFDFEHRVLHREGGVRWLRVQGSMMRDPQAGRRIVDGVQLDVTDLYEARHAVERSEATFRHLFDSMAEGYWVTGADGKVQLSNSAAAGILGYADSASMLRLDTQAIIANAAQREAFLADLLENRSVEGQEIDVFRRDGEIITLNFSTRLAGEGANLQAESTFRDVTEDKRIEKEVREARNAAEQANRAKSTFLANMSHELRTPLNAIIGYSEMMMEEAEDLEVDAFSEDLAKVHTAGTHLLALINDVLDLSKIEAGRTELFAEDFSIEELINSVIATAQPLLSKNGNQLVLNLEDTSTSLHQDLTKLRQSLLNLLSNAAKFTRHGSVTLTTRIEDDAQQRWAILAVADTGIGIAADKHEKLFEEFSQADASTTRQFGGTGLGLAISRRFCRIMGGDITIASILGEGSTFSIRVPVALPDRPTADNAESSVDPQPAKLPHQPGRTVLVIDDDREACEIIARHLTRSGFEAVTATSGVEGLALAAEIRPCAITLDVMMPVMNGFDFLMQLRSTPATSDIPVLVVTAKDLTDSDRDFLSGRVAQVLEKGAYSRDQLLGLIRTTVADIG